MAAASRPCVRGTFDSKSCHRLRAVARICHRLSGRADQRVPGRLPSSAPQFAFSKRHHRRLWCELLQERQWGLRSSTVQQSARRYCKVPGRDLQLLEARLRNVFAPRRRRALDSPPVAGQAATRERSVSRCRWARARLRLGLVATRTSSSVSLMVRTRATRIPSEATRSTVVTVPTSA
jgi:hypothetical protein